MYKVIKNNTTEPEYFEFIKMDSDGICWFWQKDSKKASLFKNKTDVVIMLHSCGFGFDDYDIVEANENL